MTARYSVIVPFFVRMIKQDERPERLIARIMQSCAYFKAMEVLSNIVYNAISTMIIETNHTSRMIKNLARYLLCTFIF